MIAIVHLLCVRVVLPRRALVKYLNGELLVWLVEVRIGGRDAA